MWRQEEKERKKREKERDKEKKATLRRMPGVKRRERERGKTQPVRFEEVQPTKEGKGQGQGEGQDAPSSKASSGAAEDGSSAKRLRHTRSHSTPNMPALEEALSSAKSNNDGGQGEKVKAIKSPKWLACIAFGGRMSQPSSQALIGDSTFAFYEA